jgi:hypothetical protein
VLRNLNRNNNRLESNLADLDESFRIPIQLSGKINLGIGEEIIEI